MLSHDEHIYGIFHPLYKLRVNKRIDRNNYYSLRVYNFKLKKQRVYLILIQNSGDVYDFIKKKKNCCIIS